jgi:Domain of unknown function (DUF4326)
MLLVTGKAGAGKSGRKAKGIRIRRETFHSDSKVSISFNGQREGGITFLALLLHRKSLPMDSQAPDRDLDRLAQREWKGEHEMVRIENKKTYRGEDVYIGWPSLLGNPFRIGEHGTRKEAIEKYRRWLSRADKKSGGRLIGNWKISPPRPGRGSGCDLLV